MKNLNNSVNLLGHIGTSPEFKELSNGNYLAKFSLATNESYKNKKGETVENTQWHNIVIWGAQAKIVRDYLVSGSQVLIEGRLTTNIWEDNDGKKHYRTEIIANEFLMLDKKKSA